MSYPSAGLPGPGQQPYGQPQQFPQQGQLVLNLRKPWGIGSAAMISPSVWIDGFTAPAQWGRNAYPAPAGTRRIAIEQTYMWSHGRAETTVELPPGQSVELHYSGPVLVFLGGRIGPVEQQRPGQLALVIFMAAIALLLVLIIIGAIAFG